MALSCAPSFARLLPPSQLPSCRSCAFRLISWGDISSVSASQDSAMTLIGGAVWGLGLGIMVTQTTIHITYLFEKNLRRYTRFIGPSARQWILLGGMALPLATLAKDKDVCPRCFLVRTALVVGFVIGAWVGVWVDFLGMRRSFRAIIYERGLVLGNSAAYYDNIHTYSSYSFRISWDTLSKGRNFRKVWEMEDLKIVWARKDLRKFGKSIQPFKSELELSSLSFSNADLKEMGPLSQIHTITCLNISNNRISWMGLKSLNQKIFTSLTTLILSETKVSNKDIEAMEESGFFKQLEKLELDGCTRITGKAVAALGGKGFQHLKWLNLNATSVGSKDTSWWWAAQDKKAACQQSLKKHDLDFPKEIIDEIASWCDFGVDFQSLQVLTLADTGLRTKVLDNIFRKAKWPSQLIGLDLSYNPELELPDSCTTLKKIDELLAETSWSYQSRQGFVIHSLGLVIGGIKTSYNDAYRRLYQVMRLR